MTTVTVSHGLDPTRCIHCVVTLKLPEPRKRYRGGVYCRRCMEDGQRRRRHTDGCLAWPWMPHCVDRG